MPSYPGSHLQFHDLNMCYFILLSQHTHTQHNALKKKNFANADLSNKIRLRFSFGFTYSFLSPSFSNSVVKNGLRTMLGRNCEKIDTLNRKQKISLDDAELKINRKLLSTHLKTHIGPEHTGEILGIEVILEDSCNIEERHLLNLDFFFTYIWNLERW